MEKKETNFYEIISVFNSLITGRPSCVLRNMVLNGTVFSVAQPL